MTRRSRAKGPPPKVQLRYKDSLAATYPTGRGYVVAFDDMRTVVFTSYQGTVTTGSGEEGLNPNNDYANFNYSSTGLLAWYPMEADTVVTGNFIAFNSGTIVPGPDLFAVDNVFTGPQREAEFDPQYIGGTVYDSTHCDHITALAGGEGAQLAKSSTPYFEFATNNPFTISAHVQFSSLSSLFNPIIWRGISASSFADWEVYVTDIGELQAGVFRNSTGANIIYTTAAGVIQESAGDVDFWYHVVVTFDGVGGFQMYVNGVLQSITLVQDTGWTQFTSNPTSDVYIGALKDTDYVGGTFRSNFRINQVTIFDRVITADEVEVLRTGDVSTPPSAGGGLNLGSGLPTDSMYMTDELETDIQVDAPLRKGVGDAWIDPLVETFTPFKDNDEPAVDGKSTNNPFYTTGSAIGLVGEGFNQPLWAKTRIEIDLTPSTSCSFYIQNYQSTSLNFPMGYWNNDTRKYEGIGLGREFAQYNSGSEITLKRLLEDQTIGFNGYFDNGGGNAFRDQAVGYPCSNFGFPYHPKFHATSSNLYPLSGTISRPFMVEKVVLYFSGAYKHNNALLGNASRAFVSTFFILNQRQPFAYDTAAASTTLWKNTSLVQANTLISGVSIPVTYNGNYVNSVRDLVTWMNVVGFNGGGTITALERELNITANSNGYHGLFVMSGNIKSALPTDGMAEPNWTSKGSGYRFLLNKANSTRSDLLVPGGRSYLGELEKGDPNSNQTNYSGLTLITLDRYSKYNPYILMPSDHLIFGWQVPWASVFAMNDTDGFGTGAMYPGKGPELEFAAFPSKIVLYGSYITQGTESHEDNITELTSLAVHEVIG